MAKVGKFCLAKRVKVEWLFQHTPCEFQCGICLVFLAQPVESHQRDLSV